MGIDRKAVLRNLEYLRSQIDSLSAEMAKDDDEYSPFMSFESFEAELADAMSYYGVIERKDICIFEFGPHRCSRCERFVEQNMDRKRKIKCEAA
jgi:hypothetical protein